MTNPQGFTEESIGQWGIPGTGQEAVISDRTGGVFYADSGHALANNSNDGTDKAAPCATLAGAVGKCTANNGDVVYLAPGHAETWTAAVSLATAGVTIIGVGEGAARPTITLSNAAAQLDLDAANIRVENVLLVANADNVLIGVDVNAAGCEVVNCELRETVGAAKHFVVAIDVTGGAVNACDRTKITGNTIKSIQVGANAGIELGEVADGVVVEGNYIYGDFADAGIHNPVGKTLTNLLVKDNLVVNLQAGDHAIELVSACTGMAVDNRLVGTVLGTILDPGSLMCLGNLESNAVDVSGTASPPTPATAPWGAGAITAASFAAGAIDSTAIAADAIGAAEIANGAIDAATFAAGAIDAAAIANGAIDAATFAAGAIDAAAIANNALDLATYAADAKLMLAGFGTSASVDKAGVAASAGVGSINLFTVAGGRVAIHGIVGEVTGACAGAQCRTKLDFNSTAAGAAYDLSTTGAGHDLNAAPDGKLFGFTGVPADTLVDGAGCLCTRPVVVDAGTIRQTTADAANAGTVAYTCYWSPITPGATVVAA